MKTSQLSVCSAVGQQSVKVEETFFHAPDEDILVKGGGVGLPIAACGDAATRVSAAHSEVTAANPANAPSCALTGVPSSRKKAPEICSDFFETCKWGDDEEDAAEFREHLIWKVHRDYPGLSPRAFEKKLEELDAIEEKKSQEDQEAWLKKFYKQILAGS